MKYDSRRRDGERPMKNMASMAPHLRATLMGVVKNWVSNTILQL